MDKKRILLVEDEPLLQKLYTDLLTAENFTVEAVSDGVSAFEKIKQGGFDLVLLDIVLPKLGGIDIVKKLKSENTDLTNKKIVFLTNLEQGKEIDEIKSLGLNYLIKSSLTPDQFIDKVKLFL